jgi:hypothetical protein
MRTQVAGPAVDPATRKAPIVESGVTAVYDRHSYDLEKRAALDFWGRRLEAIISNKRGAKILRFANRKPGL